jgi:nitrogen PTS system EIIA component
MNCSLTVSPDSVVFNLNAGSKKELLQALATKAASLCGLPESLIFETLWEREKLGTTGIGNGIAIPHGRLDGLQSVCAVFARLSDTTDFDAVDGKPVDLAFMILAPESCGADHLQALARVSRSLRDPANCALLRTTQNADDVVALFDGGESATLRTPQNQNSQPAPKRARG